MPSNNYTIRPMEPSDIPETSELLYESKLALMVNRLLFKNWPNEEIQRKNYRSVFDNLEHSPGDKLSVIANASGEVVGHFTVTRRQPAKKVEEPNPLGNEGQKKRALPEVPEHFNAEVLSAVQNACMELERVMEDTDHLQLTYIIVKPEHRGWGIGRSLMEHMFTQAKSLGLPVAVSAEPQVYEFFIKQGFKDTTHADLDLARWAPPYSGFGAFRLAGMVWYPMFEGCMPVAN